MKAGLLRHRVTLQTQVATVDDIGQPSTSWLDTASLWADVRYLTGLGALKAGADTSVGKCTIRLRHRAIEAGQRIVYGDEVFDIKQILPDGKKSYVDCVYEVINADV